VYFNGRGRGGTCKIRAQREFLADRVLGFALATVSAERTPPDFGDEENSHGWLFFDASHRERSELGEISTLERSAVQN
jgi:hypothetical protein